MVDRRSLRLGTRGSKLALCQTEQVTSRLKQFFPDRSFTTVVIRTHGDRKQTQSLVNSETGIFVRELESALENGHIDVAVHSLKDVPTVPVLGMTLMVVLDREDVRDVLVSRSGGSLSKLSSGARIGTGSPRRAAQIRASRSDIEVCAIRGNIDTRLHKVMDASYDGVVLAAAGLKRLGLLNQVSEFFEPTIFVPAPGQGALAVEARSDDEDTLELLKSLEAVETRVAVEAERAFLTALGGGCNVPVGAYGYVDDKILKICGLIAAEDGSELYRTTVEGSIETPQQVGNMLYREMLSMGAGRLLSIKG
jgi:hydroxymethylbilane synthase